MPSQGLARSPPHAFHTARGRQAGPRVSTHCAPDRAEDSRNKDQKNTMKTKKEETRMKKEAKKAAIKTKKEATPEERKPEGCNQDERRKEGARRTGLEDYDEDEERSRARRKKEISGPVGKRKDARKRQNRGSGSICQVQTKSTIRNKKAGLVESRPIRGKVGGLTGGEGGTQPR